MEESGSHYADVAGLSERAVLVLPLDGNLSNAVTVTAFESERDGILYYKVSPAPCFGGRPYWSESECAAFSRALELAAWNARTVPRFTDDAPLTPNPFQVVGQVVAAMTGDDVELR